MMDSMTDQEMDGEVAMTPGRILRISRGSGRPTYEVKQLIKTHKGMEDMLGGMGKSGMLDPKNRNAAMRNPNQMMRNMAKAMGPGIMKNFGGQQGMMDLMKGLDPSMLKKMMGSGGLGNLMKGFGGGGKR